MSSRRPADVVQSLFGQLESVENALGECRGLLNSVLPDQQTSEFADLRGAAEVLEAEARDLVNRIEVHVRSASAAAVFGIDVLV
jgi:hypothetical protein